MRRTWNSCGCSLPSRALVARAETSELMPESPLVWALNTIGVIRPLAVLTATLTSTTWFLRNGENIVNSDRKDEILPPNGRTCQLHFTNSQLPILTGGSPCPSRRSYTQGP